MLSLQVSVGDVGEIFKVRLEHDNSGSFPAWRPSQVRKSFAKRRNEKITNICGFQLSMSDKATGEELVWFLDRWLAVDEDDASLCRELPVSRADRPSLPGN